MPKLAALVTAGALTVGAATLGTVATAEDASAKGCSTWQYRTDQKAGVYNSKLRRVGTVGVGFVLNAKTEVRKGSTTYKVGNLYTPDKEAKIGYVAIPKQKLRGITCW